MRAGIGHDRCGPSATASAPSTARMLGPAQQLGPHRGHLADRVARAPVDPESHVGATAGQRERPEVAREQVAVERHEKLAGGSRAHVGEVLAERVGVAPVAVDHQAEVLAHARPHAVGGDHVAGFGPSPEAPSTLQLDGTITRPPSRGPGRGDRRRRRGPPPPRPGPGRAPRHRGRNRRAAAALKMPSAPGAAGLNDCVYPEGERLSRPSSGDLPASRRTLRVETEPRPGCAAPTRSVRRRRSCPAGTRPCRAAPSPWRPARASVIAAAAPAGPPPTTGHLGLDHLAELLRQSWAEITPPTTSPQHEPVGPDHIAALTWKCSTGRHWRPTRARDDSLIPHRLVAVSPRTSPCRASIALPGRATAALGHTSSGSGPDLTTCGQGVGLRCRGCGRD